MFPFWQSKPTDDAKKLDENSIYGDPQPWEVKRHTTVSFRSSAMNSLSII
jgi:hypothetical protein